MIIVPVGITHILVISTHQNFTIEGSTREKPCPNDTIRAPAT